MTSMSAPQTSSRLRSLFWPALIVCAAILVVFRFHAFTLPLETDEANYAYIGARLLEGQRLYVDVWDHQPPGVYVLFAAAIAAFGNGPDVFRWMATGFSISSLLLIALLTRRLANTWAAVLAALLFAFVSSDPGTGGEGVNRESYMNTLILAGWYCAARTISPAIRDEKSRGGTFGGSGFCVFAAGLFLAAASVIKTVVATHWLALAIWLAVATYQRSQRPIAVMRTILVLGAAPLIVWAGSLAYFAATARLGEFIDAVFLFNLSYSEGGGLLGRFVTFFSPPRHPFVFESAWPLWLFTGLAAIWFAARAFRERRPQALVILLLLSAGYVAVCIPAQFWPHYYYLLIPGCVVAVSTLIAELAEHVYGALPSQPRLARGAAISLFASIAVVVLVREARTYIFQSPFGITVKRYNSRDFWGRAQAENVRRVTQTSDRIFVYGNEAEIYYYSGRRCASRYTMITGLAEGMEGAERRRQILLSELEADPPRLILLLFDQPPFEAWKQFLAKHYSEQPVGADLHDKTAEAIMFVLARKDAPIEPIDWNWDRSQVGGWQLGD